MSNENHDPKTGEFSSGPSGVHEQMDANTTTAHEHTRVGSDYTGKLRSDIRASEYANRMSELQATKPRPLIKMFGSNGPTPEQAAAYHETSKAWSREYNAVSRNQKLALPRDNAAFHARHG